MPGVASSYSFLPTFCLLSVIGGVREKERERKRERERERERERGREGGRGEGVGRRGRERVCVCVYVALKPLGLFGQSSSNHSHMC